MAQKKATIIKVSDDKVSIGMEDGSFFDVSRKNLIFCRRLEMRSRYFPMVT